MTEHERNRETDDQREGGRLTDDLLEEKLREGKGPLPFVPGADGEKIEPPLPEPNPEGN